MKIALVHCNWCLYHEYSRRRCCSMPHLTKWMIRMWKMSTGKWLFIHYFGVFSFTLCFDLYYALGLISRSVIAGEKSAAFKSNHLKARHDHCEMRHRQPLFHFSHQLKSQSYAIYCLPLVIEHEVTFSKRTFPQVNNKWTMMHSIRYMPTSPNYSSDHLLMLNSHVLRWIY